MRIHTVPARHCHAIRAVFLGLLSRQIRHMWPRKKKDGVQNPFGPCDEPAGHQDLETGDVLGYERQLSDSYHKRMTDGM